MAGEDVRDLVQLRKAALFLLGEHEPALGDHVVLALGAFDRLRVEASLG